MAWRGSGVRIPSAPPGTLDRKARSETPGQLSSYAADGSCCRVGRNLGDRLPRHSNLLATSFTHTPDGKAAGLERSASRHATAWLFGRDLAVATLITL